ncbi:hypothetical protein EV121DRAFT_252687 [Schizophyllum commune]
MDHLSKAGAGGCTSVGEDERRHYIRVLEVIPFDISGALDVEMMHVKPSETMMSALSNLWRLGKEGGYIVRHGGQPVNEFGSAGNTEGDEPLANLWERAYPFLFPHGIGGLEKKRPVPVTLREHVRWCLRYHDRRFARQETFSFAIFGIHHVYHIGAVTAGRLRGGTRGTLLRSCSALATLVCSRNIRTGDGNRRGTYQVLTPAISTIQLRNSSPATPVSTWTPLSPQWDLTKMQGRSTSLRTRTHQPSSFTTSFASFFATSLG